MTHGCRSHYCPVTHGHRSHYSPVTHGRRSRYSRCNSTTVRVMLVYSIAAVFQWTSLEQRKKLYYFRRQIKFTVLKFTLLWLKFTNMYNCWKCLVQHCSSKLVVPGEWKKQVPLFVAKKNVKLMHECYNNTFAQEEQEWNKKYKKMKMVSKEYEKM